MTIQAFWAAVGTAVFFVFMAASPTSSADALENMPDV
jgi:hypothetical protein